MKSIKKVPQDVYKETPDFHTLTTRDQRPNILYFVADQMRADAQHYLGNEAAYTPHLDALSLESVAFENAYCQNPVCVPSRCSFLSGLYPHTTGHRTMHFLQSEEEQEHNLLSIMKKAGYEVIWAGRNDVIPSTRSKDAYCDAYYDGKAHLTAQHIPHAQKDFTPEMYSFYGGQADFNDDRAALIDQGCVDEVMHYLERKQTSDDQRPFMIYCSLAAPHPPYLCEKQWLSKIKTAQLSPRKPYCTDKPRMMVATARKMGLHDWEEARFDQLRATYLAMVARFDDQLGQIIHKLKETGYYDQTSIFVFSDHGDYTGDYDLVEKVQNCFEDDLTRVPLVIKPAQGFAIRPRISKALVELVDLNATVSAMTGVKLPYVHFGRSLMDVLEGSEIHKDAVFCEGGRLACEYPAMELGHEDPHDPYYPRISTQYEEGAAHTKAAMIRMGDLKYTMRLYEKDTLYDLRQDPDELVNVIDHPDYQIEILKMKLRLLKWYQETTDWIPDRKDPR